MVQILFLEFTKVTPRGPNKTPLHHIFPCEDHLMKSQPKEIFDLGPLRWWPYSFPYWVGCLTVMIFNISYGLFEVKFFAFFFSPYQSIIIICTKKYFLAQFSYYFLEHYIVLIRPLEDIKILSFPFTVFNFLFTIPMHLYAPLSPYFHLNQSPLFLV